MLIRVLAVDPHDLYLLGVEAVLKGEPDIAITTRLLPSTENALLTLIAEQRPAPHVLLIDTQPEVITTLQRVFPNIKIIAVARDSGDSHSIRIARSLGVPGYLTKEEPVRTMLPRAIRSVVAHRNWYSPESSQFLLESPMTGMTREHLIILRLISEGYTTQETAKVLDRGSAYVLNHLTTIRNFLGAVTNEQAVAIAIRDGLLKSSQSSELEQA